MYEPFASRAPDVRIGDAEREQAVGALGEHYASGRLTREELDERLDIAYGARTSGDLQPLFADLPGSGVATRTASAAATSHRGPHTSRHLSHPPIRFPLPMLLIIAVVLTIVTQVPFILFFVGWFVLGRLFHGGNRRPYAIRP